MALVGIDYLKTYLGIAATNTAGDGQLQIFLDFASADVVGYCGQDFVQRTYPGAGEDGKGDSGLYCGDSSRHLILRQGPIASITSLALDPTGEFDTHPDGSFASATLLTEGTDFVVHWDGCFPSSTTKCSRSRIVERIGTWWPGNAAYRPGSLTAQPIAARGNIKVAYVGGYPVVPTKIKNAICKLAAFNRKNFDLSGQVSSESLGGYSYSLQGPMAGQYPELGSIRELLSGFCEVVI